MYVYPYIGSGANWTSVNDYMYLNCSRYWWSNFLYINNIVPWSQNDECIAWVWYLANDMQFFIVSPFLIYLYCRSRKLGYGMLSGLIVITSIIPFAISMAYGIPGVI